MPDPHSPPKPPSIIPRGWRPSLQPDAADAGESKPRRGFSDDCEALAKTGDVLGVLAMLRSRSVLELPLSAADHLSQAVRQLEQRDSTRLVDVAFAEIIGLTSLLFLRVEILIEQWFAETDNRGGGPIRQPADPDYERLIGQCERLARFLMEVTSTKARIDHVAGLKDGSRDGKRARRRPKSTPTLEAARIEAGAGQAASRNGRMRCQESEIRFP